MEIRSVGDSETGRMGRRFHSVQRACSSADEAHELVNQKCSTQPRSHSPGRYRQPQGMQSSKDMNRKAEGPFLFELFLV